MIYERTEYRNQARNETRERDKHAADEIQTLTKKSW